MDDTGIHEISFSKNNYIRLVSVGETHDTYEFGKPNIIHHWLNPIALHDAYMVVEDLYFGIDSSSKSVLPRYLIATRTGIKRKVELSN